MLYQNSNLTSNLYFQCQKPRTAEETEVDLQIEAEVLKVYDDVPLLSLIISDTDYLDYI
jgi:hypothetical protein